MSFKKARLSILLALLAFLFLLPSLLIYASEQAFAKNTNQPLISQTNAILEENNPSTAAVTNPSPAAVVPSTSPTLTLQILSTPYGILDHNPSISETLGVDIPRAYALEAVVTNTTGSTLNGVKLVLDYDSDVDWFLCCDAANQTEDPVRGPISLDPGEAYHGYWIASYAPAPDNFHVYTVTAYIDTQPVVATSKNYYENPELFDPVSGITNTMVTIASQSTGNTGQTQINPQIEVGVAFTITIDFNLGNNPTDVTFSPVGNLTFEPTAYRLLTTKVTFFDGKNSTGNVIKVVNDRLFFDTNPQHQPTLPGTAKSAQVEYTFIALIPKSTELCSYAGVGTATTDKYDFLYCDPNAGTRWVITGTLSLSMTKTANPGVIQQGDPITYTIHYTNNGTLPVRYLWIWDDIDPGYGSIDPGSISPAPTISTTERAAWYFEGPIPPGVSGALTIVIKGDANDPDIPDGTVLTNHGYFGFNQGGIPESNPAFTQTTDVLVQAPVISISKTDGQTNALPGETLTYTLRITNSGSVAATNVTITDVLPSNSTQVNNFPSIAAAGGSEMIKIPYVVPPGTPDLTVLNNTMTAVWENGSGRVYDSQMAQDQTTVNAPTLNISKSGSDDPLLVVAGGSPLTYTLQYNNSGSSSANNVVITDTVPTNTTFDGSTCTASCSFDGTTVTWIIGNVGAGGGGSVAFTVLVTDTTNTGDIIANQDYGITSDETGFIPGTTVNTTVNKEAGYVEGVVFVDVDGDLAYSPGDTILAGVSLTLTIDSTTIPTTSISSDPGYRYRLEKERLVKVDVQNPDPNQYFQITPGTVFVPVALGQTQVVHFGFADVSSPFGVVYGTVYDDANTNQVQDLEQGLQGVTVMLSTGASTTTDLFGRFTLSHTVTNTVAQTQETNPANYVSTTPDTITHTLFTGMSYIDNFGDFAGIKLSGQVFLDANSNGINDDGIGLANATVTAGTTPFVTDGTGNYTFYLTLQNANPLLVTEDNPTGYVSTNAIPGNGMSFVNRDTLQIDAPISGTVYTGADFGDVIASSVVTITGQVWNDNGACQNCLANGQIDPGEGGLAGAIVALSSGMTATTGSDGAFTLYGLPNQAITLTEANPSGYASTNAIPGNNATKRDNDTLIIGALSSGSTSAGNNFGDVVLTSTAVITGVVYDDTNENGFRDAGEPGISGVEITLELIDGNLITVQSSFTGGNGQYQFAVAPGTTVKITSAGPGGGFAPTTPETILVNPASAISYPDNNFGYSDDGGFALISGFVFNETVTINGILDVGEQGVANANVTLVGVSTLQTSLNGAFAFIVTSEQDYAIQLTTPSGYQNTTPDTYQILNVQFGDSREVPFGLYNGNSYAIIQGTVFDDADSDGIRDTGEFGIPGVSVELFQQTLITSTQTGEYGQYTIARPFSGLRIVREEDPVVYNTQTYRSTTPDEVSVNLVLGQSSEVNFGDTLNSSFSNITGIVFEDEFTDGNFDPLSESGISGVTVTLQTSSGVVTWTLTNQYGLYSLRVDTADTYEVVETDKPGYISTTPNTVTVDVSSLDATYDGVNFGDLSASFNSVAVFGTVFNDANANAQHDYGETGLDNVKVSIVGPEGFLSEQVTTGSFGNYTFGIDEGDPSGVYTITETDPNGYVSTIMIPGTSDAIFVDNNTFIISVTTGIRKEVGDNLFGDVLATQVITISGQVWNDKGVGVEGGNGALDPGEPPLAGAVVSLNTGMSQTTGNDGLFTLFAPPGQFITVTETNPNVNYLSTNAIPGNDAVKFDDDTIVVSNSLAGGGASSGNLFGDVLQGDLGVSKSATQSSVPAGGYITYTVNIDNNGVTNGVNTVMTDTLPNNVLFGAIVSATPNLSNFTQNGQNLVWTIGTFAAGTSGQVVYTVQVKPSATGTVQNNVTIYSDSPDSDGSNDSDSTSTTIGAPGQATIWGYVFDDTDGDGLKDSGENGIGNVTVWLDGTNSTTTDPDGVYFFIVTATGVYNVMEEDPNGYFSTTPNSVNLDVTAFAASYQVDFGDSNSNSFASAYGTVFEDKDGNGQQDAGETGLQGVTVTLTDPQAGTANTTTDNFGRYSFKVNTADVYNITETDPANYFSTTPNSVNVEIALGNGYQVDFGDTPDSSNFANIFGTVFDDVDGNGVQDADEIGLQGVSVTLTDPQGGTTNATTDNFGRYSFKVDTADVFNVAETDPANYFSTTPNSVNVDVALGNDYQVDFGDASNNSSFANIFGTVFEDTNGNGQQDAGETGLPGVPVTLTDPQVGTTNAATDNFGRYSFKIGTADVYNVSETDPANYFSTTPNSVNVEVDLGNDYQVDFGDAAESTSGFGVILGTVFEDANGNGVQDSDETGLSGVQVARTDSLGSATTNTDAFGRYTLTASQGNHKVVETDPIGYFSTTPNEIHVSVSKGTTTQVDFGDALTTSGFAVILGNVFNDLNQNTIWDLNEAGIQGVSVTFDGLIPTLSDQFGSYRFVTADAIAHTVEETDLANYFSSTPNVVNVNVVSLGNSYFVNFGDFTITCTPDGYEEDDTASNGKAILSGTSNGQVHNFCDDSEDWLTLDVTERGLYTITLSATGQRADTNLELIASDKTTILAENDDFEGTTDFSSMLVWEASKTETLYIRVTNRAQLIGPETDYTIAVEEQLDETNYLFLPLINFNSGSNTSTMVQNPSDLFGPMGVIQHICPDTSEEDDTWEQAQEVVVEVVQRHSFDSNPAVYIADKDYIWFDLSADQTVTVTIPAMLNTATFLELYSSNGDSLGITGTDELVFTSDTPNRYLVSISPDPDSPMRLNFGCEDVVGYDLLVVKSPLYGLFLPLVQH